MQNKSLEALESISIKFDEMGFIPTTLTPQKDQHFIEQFGVEYNTIKQYLECLEILKKHTHINKNGDGFTITIWFNTNNCDFKSCATMEECLFVKEVLSK